MSGGSNQRIGTLIKQARTTRRLSLRGLADLCDASVATLSAIERGTRNVSLPLADRILGAMELELHLETQPRWEAIDAAIAEAAGRPLQERIADWEIEFTPFVSWFAETPYMADGLMAAALQGAPVPVTAFEMAVPRDDDSLDRLTVLLNEMRASRWSVFWLQWSASASNDPREAEADMAALARRDGATTQPSGPDAFSYECRHGRFRIRLVDELAPVLWADIEDLSQDCARATSLLRAMPMLTRVRLPLVPLAEVETADRYARRVLDRMRRTD
ncbi:helix-turn-helix transcriptional regulator [Actinoallomurus sp. NPDC052274]|uniref:helix-turn-helix domain-containing protein n=1 Tax=Actinoallomurus sp. NPDC052274 TaxID=3155420 RepID=UPI00341265C1